MTHYLCGLHDLPHGDEDLSGKVVLEHGGVEGGQGTGVSVHGHRLHPVKTERVNHITIAGPNDNNP